MIHRSLIVALCLTLSACGIKPKDLSAPHGADPQAYPKTYPAAK